MTQKQGLGISLLDYTSNFSFSLQCFIICQEGNFHYTPAKPICFRGYTGISLSVGLSIILCTSLVILCHELPQVFCYFIEILLIHYT